MREALTGARALLRPPPLRHHPLMAKGRKGPERVQFIAPMGTRTLYDRVAALEELPVATWIRATLHEEAARVLAAHGEDTADMPPAHLARPPRLQPRLELPDPDADDER